MTDHKPEKNEEEVPPPENQKPDSENNNPESAPAGNEAEQVPMVGLTMEEYTTLQNGVEKAKNEAKEYLDGWQRERAEFTNYRRRVERDQAQTTLNLTGQVIKKYLVILDDLDRALKARPTEGEGASWAEGVELIYRKLQSILEAEGVQRIPAVGLPFDPTQHEALMQDDSPNHKSGEVIEVLQQGYKIGERVLRPALVRVAR